MKMAEWKEGAAGEILINEKQAMSDLYLIYNGKVEILIGNKKINELKDGQFIGEMSFLSSQLASATVKILLPTIYIKWNQVKLKELMSRNPSIIYSLQAAMGAQLTQALNAKNNS
jgi:CRP-like cAMP-binding protein